MEGTVKVLKSGVWCHRCKLFIEKPCEMECGQCHTEPWQDASIIIQTTGEKWEEK